MPDLTPPHNEDLEIELLGSIMLNPGSMDDVCTLLNDDAFYNPVHSIIYSAIRNLHKTVLSYDLSSVTDELIKQKKLEKIGGKAKLVLIQEQTPLGIDIKSHCQKVQDLYLERQLGELGNRFVQLSQKGGIPVRERLQEAEKGLFNLSQQSYSSVYESPSDIAFKIFTTIEERAKNGQPPGIPTGFPELDDVINGLKPANSIYVMGRSGMGKSSFVLQIADHVSTVENKPVYFVSLEMSSEELTMKMVSRRSRINGKLLEAGKVRDDQWEDLTGALGEVGICENLKIDDYPYQSIDEIASKARKLKTELDIGLLCIDHIQIISYENKKEYEALCYITRSIKNLSKELNIPVIALSQMNNSVESRQDKRPQPSDARGSGSIIQDSDVILGLYRDSEYNEDTPEPDICEIIPIKNRNGPKNKVKLVFEPQYSNFRSKSTR